MSRSFAATMRKSIRLMRPSRQAKAARSIRKAMTSLVLTSALAPITKPKKTKKTRQLKLPTQKTAGKVMPRIPGSAQYLSRRHRSTAGTRGFKLYLPASCQKGKPKGLILMLHGCNQTSDDFAIGTHMFALAEKHGLAVAYPSQTRRDNRKSCWNWFNPAHQFRGVGEPEILASLTRKLMREFGIGRDAVFVAGLSAGGAMAVILADLYPDLYSAAGVHSGLARGSARGVVSAIRRMQSGGASGAISPMVAASISPVRRIIFQGLADMTVHHSNAAMIVAAAVGNEAVPIRIGKRSSGGRGYTRSDYVDADGIPIVEHWLIEGAGHAWSGGRAAGSYTDRSGPDASAHMVRFFLKQK